MKMPRSVASICRANIWKKWIAAARWTPPAIVAQPKIDAVCRRVAKLAHHHYDEAHRILAAKPRGRIKTPRLMGAVYSEILRASEAQGFAPPRRRVSLPKSRLLSLVLRQGLFS
jgi:phytoene synthase